MLSVTRKRFETTEECQLCLKKNEVGATAQQYCLTSTLHGLRYVGDASLSLLERYINIPVNI